MRSGRPNVVLPLAADQPFWARRIYAGGASPAPLSAHDLTAARVAEAVQQALESQHIRECASALGVSIRQEAGLHKAVEIIQRFS